MEGKSGKGSDGAEGVVLKYRVLLHVKALYLRGRIVSLFFCPSYGAGWISVPCLGDTIDESIAAIPFFDVCPGFVLWAGLSMARRKLKLRMLARGHLFFTNLHYSVLSICGHTRY